MQKLLQVGSHFATGEPTAQLVAFRNRSGGLSIEKRAFADNRSPIYDFLSTVQPEPGISYILVNALGAYEYYDDNSNADGFPLRPYKVGELAHCGHPECTKSLDGWISEEETLGHHYKTFEEHGGIYKHHVNKDPSKSLGWVNKALLNPYMHRVELLLKYVDSRAPDIAQRIADKDYPAVSMGCHVRWDVCTICGHRAPTRAQYCEHALRMLRRILPDGRKCSVLNPSPKFFDISFVFRPADVTGWMMKKVAEDGLLYHSADMGALVEAYNLRKIEIYSVQTKTAATLQTPYGAQLREEVQSWPSMPKEIFGIAKTAGATTVLASLAAHGVLLGDDEVIELFAKCAGIAPTDHELDCLTALVPSLEDVFAHYPSLGTKLGALVTPRIDAVKADAIRPLHQWVEKRGGFGEFLRQQMHDPRNYGAMDYGPGAYYRSHEPAKSDVLTMTDPNTGMQYQTTRGAAMEAHNQSVKAQLAATATLGGLYAGGLHLGLKGRLGLMSLPLGLAAGYATDKALGLSGPYSRYHHYMTDQGIPVDGSTEFMKSSGLQRPTASDILSKAAYDEQPRGCMNRTELYARIERNGNAKLASWLRTTTRDQKVAALVANAELPLTEGAVAPELDIATLAQNVSRLIWG